MVRAGIARAELTIIAGRVAQETKKSPATRLARNSRRQSSAEADASLAGAHRAADEAQTAEHQRPARRFRNRAGSHLRRIGYPESAGAGEFSNEVRPGKVGRSIIYKNAVRVVRIAATAAIGVTGDRQHIIVLPVSPRRTVRKIERGNVQSDGACILIRAVVEGKREFDFERLDGSHAPVSIEKIKVRPFDIEGACDDRRTCGAGAKKGDCGGKNYIHTHPRLSIGFETLVVPNDDSDRSPRKGPTRAERTGLTGSLL